MPLNSYTALSYPNPEVVVEEGSSIFFRNDRITFTSKDLISKVLMPNDADSRTVAENVFSILIV